MAVQVIVLNGTASAGKSAIARCLQAVLPDPWLTVGIDTLIRAMPRSTQDGGDGIELAPDGQITVGPRFRAVEAAWMTGIAAMATAGARLILDEVFLGGVTARSPPGGNSPAGTGSRAWPRRRRTWCTGA